MSYWNTPPMDRAQGLLFYPTLDAVIPEDHPVRLFDEILSGLDWSAWEARYHGRRGRPPIPPKVMASVLLYGLSAGLRSSRRLEEACGVRLDFLWLTSGRRIDHSTLCEFRTAFCEELKETFRQTGRVAMTLGLLRLNRIGLDGTRVRANSSRHTTATAKTLAERVAVLDAEIEAAFAEAAAADGKDADLFGSSTPNRLPSKLADLKRRQARIREALEKARLQDAKRASKKAASSGSSAQETTGDVPTATSSAPEDGAAAPAAGASRPSKPRAAKVPVTDPDAAVMPDKDGGYSPNYQPVLAVDGERGYLVDVAVSNRPAEGQATVATMERIAETFGEMPAALLADGAYADGQQLAALEARNVTTYVPVKTARGNDPTNPALRADPAQPVPEALWDRLPRSSKGKKRPTLDRSAFVRDEGNDCFYCPMGRVLRRKDTQRRRRGDGGIVEAVRYECVDCTACRLSEACRQGKTPRRVQVDEYEPVRERVQDRMNSPTGRSVYAARLWICETPFGFLKSWMQFRQFLLRGLEKVQTEWCWASTAYNLRKLVGDIGRMRAKLAALAV